MMNWLIPKSGWRSYQSAIHRNAPRPASPYRSHATARSLSRLLAVLALLVVWAAPASAARMYSYSAEFTGTTTSLSGVASCAGSPAVNATAARSGGYGMEVTGMASATAMICRFNNNPSGELTTGANWYGRIYIKFVTLPSATTSTVLSWSTNGNTSRVAWVNVNNAGSVAVYDEDGQVGTACNTTVSTGTWYRFELHVNNGADTTTANDSVEFRIDGTDQTNCSATNRDLDTGFSNFVWGGNVNLEAQTTGNWYTDDGAINDTTGSAQTSWPGAGALGMAFVDANGDMTNAGVQGTDWDTCTSNSQPCTTGTGGTAFQSVDEVGLTDSGTTTVLLITESTTTTDPPVLQFSVQTLTSTGTSEGVAIDSNDTIQFLAVRSVAPGTSTGGQKEWTTRIVSGSTVQEAAAEQTSTATNYVLDSSATGQAYARVIAYVDPATSAAWTLSAADAVEIGVRNTDATPDGVHISQMTLEYEWTPVANGASTVNTRGMLLRGLGR